MNDFVRSRANITVVVERIRSLKSKWECYTAWRMDGWWTQIDLNHETISDQDEGHFIDMTRTQEYSRD